MQNEIYDRVFAQHPDLLKEIEKKVEEKMQQLRHKVPVVVDESLDFDIEKQQIIDSIASPNS